jgi:integrase/recombinase XerD
MTDLPAKRQPSNSNADSQASGSSQRNIWVRINAFLELKSANTQRTYVSIINEWSEFLGAPAGTPAAAEKFIAATDLHAVAYKKWLEKRPGQKPRLSRKASHSRDVLDQIKTDAPRDGLQRGLSNATIAKKFAALRRIYRMLIATEPKITQNPFDVDRVPVPPAKSGQRRPTEMVAFEKVKQVLDLPDVSTPKGMRDRAILSLLFGAGLRRSELVRLRIGDVRRSPNGTDYIYLRSTKAKKDAEQSLPTWAASDLQALIADRVSSGAQSGDYVFVSFRGQGGKTPTNHRLSDSGLYRLFKRYCDAAGAGEFATPHSARATAITKLLADGLGHREVQEFSRHASVQMVEVYDKRRLGIEANPGKDLEY